MQENKALIGAFKYKNIPDRIKRALTPFLFLVILAIAIGCTEEQPTTWEDVKHIKINFSVDGVGFDIPLNYQYRLFNKNLYNWPALSDDVREGKTRRVVDYINIDALLPDVEPIKEDNLEYFMELGWGRKIRAFITHPRSFAYYFKYSAPNTLESLPEDPKVPGLLHYKDKDNQDDIFLSHDYAISDLIRIRCKYVRPGKHPRCTVETQYQRETNLVKNGEQFSTVTPFYLNYSFARSYLPQCREIDRKIKALFDQFALSATEQP